MVSIQQIAPVPPTERPAGKVSCRQIEMAHLPEIVNLLAMGFPRRSRVYWENGLHRLAQYRPPEGFPQFGYMLRVGERPIGVHLLISSPLPDGDAPLVRCNGSSWYVEESFRSYGLLLLIRATRQQPAMYTNISPRPETLPIIEAQGFRKYSQGMFVALPVLTHSHTPVRHFLTKRSQWEAAGVRAQDIRLLSDHADFGCLPLWWETTADCQVMIFRRRLIKSCLPCAQLIYCRSLEALEENMGAVGRYLAARGMPLVLVPSDRPLRGVPGRFFPDKMPMYAKGPRAPRIGDLSYTEAALLGL
jgi:hypothetical protein